MQPKYRNQCSTTPIAEISASLNDARRKVVEEIWFGELMKAKRFEINLKKKRICHLRSLTSSIVSLIFGSTRQGCKCLFFFFFIGIKSVNVSKKDVERILGVKSGTIDIRKFLVKGNY